MCCIPLSEQSPTLRRRRWSVRVALAAGLTVIATAIAVTLSRSPLALAGTNSIPLQTLSGVIDTCQGGEVLPSGTTAMRIWIRADIGPSVSVVALSGARVVTRGGHEAGWTGEVLTIPVAPVRHAVAGARVCVRVGQTVETVDLLGAPASRGAGGEPEFRMRIEYLRPGGNSWWSLARSVAHRMGLGRAPSGTWMAFVP